jgi:tRNA(Ile)-lysidine synthase
MTRSLDEAMQDFHPALPLGVGFSGGADSTALLMACYERWPGQVVALHVNHGLQSAATAFELHCNTVCAQLQIPLRISSVDARHSSGQSPEDAARQARYKAFSALAFMDSAQPAIQSIALAQHADDQVETLLLALSRGAGVAGLSAMPSSWVRDGIQYYRPLLSVSGAELREWLTQRAVLFVEDPTNADEQFTRNRIRAQLLPALQNAFPHFRDTFARSAGHAAQAQELLNELAAQDLEQLCAGNAEMPRIKNIQLLTRARQSNALRHWLKSRFNVIPSTAQMDELLRQVAACSTRGHRIHIKVGQGFVRRVGNGLTWYNP